MQTKGNKTSSVVRRNSTRHCYDHKHIYCYHKVYKCTNRKTAVRLTVKSLVEHFLFHCCTGFS